MLQYQLKKLLKGLIISGILLLSLILNINIVYSEDICFKEIDANKILMDLETGHLDKLELVLFKQKAVEYEKQILIWSDKFKLKDDQLNICNDTVTKYQTLRTDDKKACDEAVKAAKPSFKDILLYSFGVLGAGLLLGLLL